MTYGIISNNVYDYRVKKREISFDNIPSTFDGIRICHISDIHIGSLKNRVAVKGGIDMILNEKPDVIFFTGDLVNDKSEELKGWGNDLSKIISEKINEKISLATIYNTIHAFEKKKYLKKTT